MKSTRLLTLLNICFALFISINLQSQHTVDVSEVFGNKGEIYFKFLPEYQDLNSYSKIISLDKIEGNEVFAYANKREFESFLKIQSDFELLPKPGELIKNPKMKSVVNIKEIEEWDFYPTYDAYVDMMYQYATEYPDICEVVSIGTTPDGHELLMVKISNNISTREAEPQFLYTGTMHGDETAGYILILRLADYLLSNYGTNDDVTNLVNSTEIWLNPLANPDGTYAGGNNSVYGATRYNSNNVDLNRNYPDPEDGPHPDGNSWQPETICFMDMAEENTFVMSGNTHGGAEVLNYPWDTWAQLAADDSWWIYVCREYADTVHLYSPSYYLSEYNNGITNGYQWYSIDGGRQDYMNYFHNCRELTMELSGTKLLPASQLENHWDWNYRSLINYMEQATFGVNGIVTDLETGEPLEAKILIEGHDIDNSFVFSCPETGFYQRLLDDGSYDLTISAPGHMPVVIENVSVSRLATTTVDVELDAGDLTADFSTAASNISIGSSTDFIDESYGNPVTWAWTFEGGDPAVSSEQNPTDINYTDAGSFDVSLTVFNNSGDSQTITKEDYITVNAEYIMSNQTVSTCTGLFFDTGGENGNYADNEDFTMTFLPGVTGAKILAEFLSFDVEYHASCDYDWLKIYDGSSVSATLLGTWCGSDSPGIIEATNEEGALTFEFHSDYSQTGSGWKTAISCTSVPLLPVANFTADATHIVEGESVQFSDESTNNPTTWAWTFVGGDPEFSSEQNPVITYYESGVYDVSMIVQNEFGSDTKTIEGYIIVDSAIGINEANAMHLSFYPNPVTGNTLTIESPENIIRVDILNHLGLTQKNIECNSKSVRLNAKSLPTGIHFIRVYTTSGMHVEKLSRIK